MFLSLKYAQFASLMIALSFCSASSTRLEADLIEIDFDTNPLTGQAWTGELVGLSGTEWQASHGVTMGFRTKNFRKMYNIKEGGPSFNAFASGAHGDDQLVPGDPSGGWFVSNDAIIATPTGTIPIFDIQFEESQAIVGMNILDLDRMEAWEIRAYTTGTINPLEIITLDAQVNGQADARSTFFEFNRALAQITRLEIEYVGNASTIGFAFDGLAFSRGTTPVPEPGSWLLMSSIAGICGYRKRRKQVVNRQSAED